ncbi:RNA polymerase sigma-70 factor [Pleomorphomonas diazotrophica]|uniref:RNA polymerase sigma-70 factor n=1 Tax=Pleomorphomonas diazotrophica TaxID=1166257 RepID=A0A1I4QP24_9HYPH|nr:RNA polymerase sigma-70 factor [Pleomorphomonas diazotrophica]SFM41787.1 RNA polymerase sigma-70 factor, ECF subfamily [Pleomorphomonas diazotrophica]
MMAAAASSFGATVPLPFPSRGAVKSDSATPARSEDDLLLERIANDDRDAFARLVERHADRGFALALRILKNSDDAEDVVQDSFLKLWTHRKRMEIGRAKFSTWLYRVITNRCIDLRRKPAMDDIETAPEVADGADDALTLLHRASMTSLLEVALSRLPDQQRVAVILSYHEAMSNAEIAEVMETTVMAVESLLKRGRQQLRKHLARAEDDIRQSFTRG